MNSIGLFWRSFLPVILGLIASLRCASPDVHTPRPSDLEVKIVGLPEEVMPGAIYINPAVEIQNISEHSVKIFYRGQFERQYGVVVSLSMRRADGKPYQMKPRKFAEGLRSVYPDIRPMDIISTPLFFSYDEPAEYILQAIASSAGAYENKTGPQLIEPEIQKQIWAGEIRSPEYRFNVLEPEGIDKTVWEKFQHYPIAHDEEVIKNYPTSIYAGYALFRKGPGIGGSHEFPEITLAISANLTPQQRNYVIEHAGASQIGGATYPEELKERLMANPKFKPKCFLAGKNHLELRINATTKFIKAHPDFQLVANLRQDLAIELYLLSRDSEALAQVMLLSELPGKPVGTAGGDQRERKLRP